MVFVNVYDDVLVDGSGFIDYVIVDSVFVVFVVWEIL